MPAGPGTVITTAQRPSTPPVQAASDVQVGVKQRPTGRDVVGPLPRINEVGVHADPPEQSSGLVHGVSRQSFWK